MLQIGILQLTQNLDDAVRGFKDALDEHGLAAEFHYANADGALGDLPGLARQLAHKQVDIIFACSTPSALAAIKLAGNIPVVFTPVFDPVGANLIASMDKPGGKATGVAGMVLASAKVNFITELLPSIKTIGILYHTGDSNAVLECNNFIAAAKNSYALIELPISKPEDLSELTDRLSAEIDALFIPIGRVIEENFATVAYYAEAANLPVITSHAPNVPAGALGALVADHYRLGCDCAAKALQILAGTAPGDIPVGIVQDPDILLNTFVAANLGIELPAALQNKAKEIFQ